MIQQPLNFWDIPQADLLAQLEPQQEELSSEAARRRLINCGANLFKPPKRSDTALLLAQFKTPIVLTLAAGLSFSLQDNMDAVIILFIVLVSGLLGFWQERGTERLWYVFDLIQSCRVVRGKAIDKQE